MEQVRYILVFITAASLPEAENISKTLVQGRLAACASVVPEVNSNFWWKDKLETTRESLLVIKTKSSLLPDIITAVKKIHSYSIPEIIALPIIGGSPDYLEWIDGEVK
jgi:periplasmic divalent cation tolerance protein